MKTYSSFKCTDVLNSVHRYFGNTHKPNIKDIWNMIMYDYDVNLKGMFIYNPMHNYAYLFNFLLELPFIHLLIVFKAFIIIIV